MFFDSYTIGAMIGLFLFGVAYNALVSWMETRPGGHDGFTAFLVVGGVVVTVLAMTPVIGWMATAHIALGFICSGLAMIVGSVARYMRKRADEIRHIEDLEHTLITNGNNKECNG